MFFICLFFSCLFLINVYHCIRLPVVLVVIVIGKFVIKTPDLPLDFFCLFGVHVCKLVLFDFSFCLSTRPNIITVIVVSRPSCDVSVENRPIP